MIIWLRVFGGLAAVVALLTVLDAVSLWILFSGRVPEEAEAAPSRSGEFVWMMIFLLVMATSLLAAARRWAGRLGEVVLRSK